MRDLSHLTVEQVRGSLTGNGYGADNLLNVMFLFTTQTSGACYIMAYEDDDAPGGIGLGHVYVKDVNGQLHGEF